VVTHTHPYLHNPEVDFRYALTLWLSETRGRVC